MRTQYCHTALIKIQGVEDSEDVDFYLGKKIAYIFKAHTEKKGSKYRVVWGKVCRSHGTNGVVKCKFRTNLPVRPVAATAATAATITSPTHSAAAAATPLTLHTIIFTTTAAEGDWRPGARYALPVADIDDVRLADGEAGLGDETPWGWSLRSLPTTQPAAFL